MHLYDYDDDDDDDDYDYDSGHQGETNQINVLSVRLAFK